MFNNSELESIKEILVPEKKILIVTHFNPDGDAIGSTLGLLHFLRAKGLQAEAVVPNDFPKFLKWMPDAKKIIIAEYKKRRAFELFENADVIFCLDFNFHDRIGILGEALQRATAKKILIDHHQQPQDFDFVYSDTTVPATCQMVYNFIKALGNESLISKESAECLYCGIMTDTGGFRFRSTSADTHRIIASLIEKGAEPAEISSKVLDTNSVSRLKLLALVLERIELIEENTVSVLYLKRSELREYGFEKGDTEGFVNYGLSIAGTKMSAFFMEDLYDNFIRISFRSKDNVDCNAFARKYFNGGGHINAAGGKFYQSIENTIEFFKEKVAEDSLISK